MDFISRIEHNNAIERLLDAKRSNFIIDYELTLHPALIWQCLPVEDINVNIEDSAISSALQEGARGISDSGWWYGFGSSRYPSFTFDGITSCRPQDAAGHVTEMHTDGHLLASVWSFPQLNRNSTEPSPVVADFYCEAFKDFAYVANKIYTAAKYHGELIFTCTMHQANQLPFAGNTGNALAPAPSRKSLRWPIVKLANLEDLFSASIDQAARFMRTYGRRPQKLR